MTDNKPGLILTISAMARLLVENLDRADTEAFAHAAAIIDAAAQTPGVPPHNVEQWQRAIALYNAALLEFPAHDATPEIPADWFDYQPPPEVYTEFEPVDCYDRTPAEREQLCAADLSDHAEAYRIWADVNEADGLTPASSDTQRKPRVSFEP